MIYFWPATTPKFYTSSYNGSLVTNIKQNSEYSFCEITMLVYILHKTKINESCIFSINQQHTEFTYQRSNICVYCTQVAMNEIKHIKGKNMILHGNINFSVMQMFLFHTCVHVHTQYLNLLFPHKTRMGRCHLYHCAQLPDVFYELLNFPVFLVVPNSID
jgi:hypothetical protein